MRAVTFTGNFLIPFTKFERTRVTSSAKPMSCSRGSDSPNISRIPAVTISTRTNQRIVRIQTI